MKKFKTIALGFFVCSVAMISSVSGSDWGFTIGAQYWKPDWEYDRGSQTTSGETNGIMGPTALITYKKFSMGASYYTGDFEITLDSDPRQKGKNRQRDDLDVIFTYSFKYLNLMAVYKNLKYERGIEDIDDYLLETDVSGFGAGLSSKYVISGSGFYIFGSALWMPSLTGDETWNPVESGDTVAYDVTADGFNFEAGLGYFWQLNPSFGLNTKAAYRMQNLSYDYDYEYVSDADETFQGIRFEISGVF